MPESGLPLHRATTSSILEVSNLMIRFSHLTNPDLVSYHSKVSQLLLEKPIAQGIKPAESYDSGNTFVPSSVMLIDFNASTFRLESIAFLAPSIYRLLQAPIIGSLPKPGRPSMLAIIPKDVQYLSAARNVQNILISRGTSPKRQ